MTHAAAHAIDKCGLSSELMAQLFAAWWCLLAFFSVVILVHVNGYGRVESHRFVKRWVATTAAIRLSHKLCFHFCSIGCADTSLLFSSGRSPHLHWWVWAYRACHIGPFATVSSPLIRLLRTTRPADLTPRSCRHILVTVVVSTNWIIAAIYAFVIV